MDNFPSVVIGNQVWMSVNLNVRKFRNGEPVPEVRSFPEWQQSAENHTPAFCFFNHLPFLGRKYGKLYNWYAVMDPRGLAPGGWLIPDVKDWEILSAALGGESGAGIRLKSTKDWDWDGSGTNDSGFKALPGGYRRANDGGFAGIEEDGLWWKDDGFWWTSTPCSDKLIWGINLSSGSGHVFKFGFSMGDGLSVRCLKNLP